MSEFHYTDLAGFESSVLDLAAYNSETEDLFVKFLSGAERIYEDVEPSTFTEFSTADSPGAFYNRQIKGVYDTYEPVGSVTLVFDPPALSLVTNDEPVVPVGNPWDIKTVFEDIPVANGVYGVKYNLVNTMIVTEFSVNAANTDDALNKFYAEITRVLPDVDTKVLAVTQYFE